MVAQLWSASAAQGSAFVNSPTSLNVSKPSASAAGDVVYAFVIHAFQAGSVTPSISGFTQVVGRTRFATSLSTEGWVFRRVLDGSEGSTFTVNYAGAVTIIPTVMCLLVRGADPVTPEDVAGVGATTTNGATNIAPSVSPVSPGTLLLCAFGWRGTNPYPIPSGMSNGTDLSGTTDMACRSATEAITPAGATGTRTSVAGGGSGQDGVSFSIAVRSLVITTATPSAVGHTHAVSAPTLSANAQAAVAPTSHAHTTPSAVPFNGVYALPATVQHSHAIAAPAPRASSAAAPSPVPHSHDVETPYAATVIQVPGTPVEPDASGPADRFPQGPYDPARAPAEGTPGVVQYRPGGVDYT